ncbi:hypothetical protein [Motiliproteus sediminis]|uniref:hypothetical protein n=1 Tax=Motiliproteus sediminis TaxID=1468178 RepID=UPI001AEFDA97|nr:hypothetical protein [Motiliproteus sediminis]
MDRLSKPRLAGLLLSLLALPVCADTTPNTTEPGWLSITGAWLETQRDDLSEVVLNSAAGIDGYIARDDITEPLVNESYVRVRMRERLEKGGERNFDADIKAKLKLPHTKNQLRLTFDSDPDDFESISNRRRDQGPASSSRRDLENTTVVGLGYLSELGRHWKSDYNVGIRLHIPLNPYARANFSRVIELPDNWQTILQQKFSYFHEERFRAETSVDFFRPLTERLTFQSSTAGQFIDRDDNWELYQALSLHQSLTHRSAFQHQIGVSGDTRPRTQTRDYWIRTEYRHQLYKNWLYGKIAPELFFTRDNNFRLEPILTFELELFFGYAEDRI